MKTLSSSLETIKEIVDAMYDRDLQMRIHAALFQARQIESKLVAVKELAHRHQAGDEILAIIGTQ